jgi:prepilin-type N-terminal cleavage/methylation domain-containing protein
MRNRDGFTLLELVAALSLSAVIGIWAAGFFGSQMHEYKKQTQILKTEELAATSSSNVNPSLFLIGIPFCNKS